MLGQKNTRQCADASDNAASGGSHTVGLGAVHRFTSQWSPALAAALGYSVLLLWPLLLLALLVFGDLLAGVRSAVNEGEYPLVGLQVAVVAWSALASVALWRLQPAPPDGYGLARDQAPELFKLLDELRASFADSLLGRCTHIHRVLITEGTGVSVMRVPRLGIPVLHTNYLLIGLASAQTCTVPQFKAELARAVGLLNGSRQSGLAWLYHLRRTWHRYTDLPQLRPAPVRWCLQVFFQWFAPWYEAQTRDVARACERIADAYALEVVDPESVAESLIVGALLERYLERKFWPAIERLCGKLPQPTHFPYEHLERAIRQGTQTEELRTWLHEAFHAKADEEAVLALRARVQDLGWPREPIAGFKAPSAAQTFLRPALAELVQALDQTWWQRNQSLWARRFRRHQNAKPKLQNLVQKLHAGSLNEVELRALLKLAQRYLRGDRARALYEDILRQRPGDARLHLAIGRKLLRQNDAAGVDALARAMKLEDRYATTACKLISAFRAGATRAQRSAAQGNASLAAVAHG